MERVAVWWGKCAKKGRAAAELPYMPVLAGTLLGFLAVAELAVELSLNRGLITRSAVVESIVRAGSGSVRVRFALALGLLCLSTTLPLAFLRPLTAGIAVTTASVLSLAFFNTLTVAGSIAQLIAGYRLGRGGSQVLAVVIGLPFLVLALAGPSEADFRVRTMLLASLAPVTAMVGIVQRARGEARRSTAAQQVIAGTLLEHTARGERARIARELHDVVAHHISMVAVQAETARLATPGMPAQGAKRLLEIGDTSRAALTEMRRLLGVLREDTRTGAAVGAGSGNGDRRPQPNLRQLNELLDEIRDASGTAARLIIRGAPDTLDPGVEVAAYRIVQESLTNARRHARGAAVDVELYYTADTLRLRVRDNGPGPATTAKAAGHGLLGMRERATAVGGEVRTGPTVGGGFLVEAILPANTKESR